ncbi:hypothetical protein [Olivibacter jilunii]|uniref:Uncharacterized protein n=1 Tax=Olivibacter jilunii TaxID=985016 RepID=A0ABW6B4D8_9SPHI
MNALPEKKGVATFFLPWSCLSPAGLGKIKASSFLSVSPAGGGLYGQKHNLPNTKQKKPVMPFRLKTGVPDLNFGARLGTVQTDSHIHSTLCCYVYA